MFRNFALGLTLALMLSPANAQEIIPGWTSGPPADATMDKGRRFDCAGTACPPEGLSCLHAAAPHMQGKRVVPTSDLLRRKGMPWKEIEAWLGQKLVMLKPDLAGKVTPKTWTIAEAAKLAADRKYVEKRYDTGAAGEVPLALWMEKGAMNVVVCTTAADGAARIAALVQALNKGDVMPVKD
ncbi:hypothetical protein [Aureimonas sp. SA4125]|uniref:hypothetical protein n=1 Tax=Aureimonas sp. SA4125 TaxID=2826993 RepID=UPI001CC489CC|nr:hypothetical protein [Aureimonas sp. SA4125]